MLLLRQSVVECWYDWNAPLEGAIPYLYLDVRGLVTCAVGYLCDSPEAAASIPFLAPDGTLAPRAAIRAEWLVVKNDPLAAQQGHTRAREITRLRLEESVMRSLTAARLAALAAELARAYPDLSSYPADAQLALCSMGWAMGGAFPAKFPRFSAAVRARDFAAAAAECKMREAGNPGLVPRNRRNRAHLLAAAEAWGRLDDLCDDP